MVKDEMNSVRVGENIAVKDEVTVQGAVQGDRTGKTHARMQLIHKLPD